MPKKEPIKFQDIIESECEIINGKKLSTIAKEKNIPKERLMRSLSKIDDVMNSKSPILSVERKIISEAITDRLKPIKEELAIKSLEIINMADNITVERLQDDVLNKTIKMKDLLNISDIHSKRLARITGLEEDPNAGNEDPLKAAKTINVFISDVFKNHKDKLDRERNTINTLDATPIYDNDDKNNEEIVIENK